MHVPKQRGVELDAIDGIRRDLPQRLEDGLRLQDAASQHIHFAVSTPLCPLTLA